MNIMALILLAALSCAIVIVSLRLRDATSVSGNREEQEY